VLFQYRPPDLQRAFCRVASPTVTERSLLLFPAHLHLRCLNHEMIIHDMLPMRSELME
jgi:hypothetical protein